MISGLLNLLKPGCNFGFSKIRYLIFMDPHRMWKNSRWKTLHWWWWFLRRLSVRLSWSQWWTRRRSDSCMKATVAFIQAEWNPHPHTDTIFMWRQFTHTYPWANTVSGNDALTMLVLEFAHFSSGFSDTERNMTNSSALWNSRQYTWFITSEWKSSVTLNYISVSCLSYTHTHTQHEASDTASSQSSKTERAHTVHDFNPVQVDTRREHRRQMMKPVPEQRNKAPSEPHWPSGQDKMAAYGLRHFPQARLVSNLPTVRRKRLITT